MFTPFVYAASVALFSLRSFVYASPLVAREGQGVWNPPITAPRAGDIWTVGSTQLVTWDTNKIPPSAMNNTGTLFLGYFDGDSHGENLDTYRPLADRFLLTDGGVDVQVPDVSPRDTYIVVLMGNSGNASPEFSIINPSKSGKSHKPFHQANSQKHSDSLNSNQLPPPGVAPFPTFPPDPPFPGPQIDRTQAGPLLENKPAPGPRTESHSNSNGGGTRSSTRNPASGEGQDKNC